MGFLRVLVLVLWVSIGSGFSVSEASVWTQCQSVLKKISSTELSESKQKEFDRWQKNYIKQAQEKNKIAGVALVNMLALKAEKFGFSRRVSTFLNDYGRILQKKYNIHVSGIFDSGEKYIGGGLLAFTTNWLWSSTPYVLRGVPPLIKAKGIEKTFYEFLTETDDDLKFEKVLGIKADQFFLDLLEEYFSFDAEKEKMLSRYYNSNGLKKILLPFFFAAAGLDPLSAYTVYAEGSSINIQNLSILSDSYLNQARATFENKNIVFISDTAFGNPEELINPSVSEMNSVANSVSYFSVASMNDFRLALENSRNADLVIIMAHGSPGSFLIGSTSIRDHITDMPENVIKDDASLIYISCHFGEPAPVHGNETQNATEEETWIRLSRRLMRNSGRAVASTSLVAYESAETQNRHRPNNRTRGTQSGSKENQILGAILDRIELGAQTGVWIREDLIDRIETADDMAAQYEFSYATETPGFRIYDVRTGRVRYVPAE